MATKYSKLYDAGLQNSNIAKSDIKSSFGKVAAANADAAGTIYRHASIPSNMIVRDLKLSCDAMGALATIDVGAYYTEDHPQSGAVIDADFFGSAIDIATALSKVSIINESGTNDLDKQEMPLWEALGLPTDPICKIDICSTVVADIAADGNIAIEIQSAE